MFNCYIRSLGIFAVQGWDYVTEPVHLVQFITAIIVLAAVGLASLVSVTLGAQRYDSRFFLPSFLACCNLLSALYGLAIGEFEDASILRTALFGLFIVIAMASIGLGAMHTNSTDEVVHISRQVSKDVLNSLEEGASRAMDALSPKKWRQMKRSEDDDTTPASHTSSRPPQQAMNEASGLGEMLEHSPTSKRRISPYGSVQDEM